MFLLEILLEIVNLVASFFHIPPSQKRLGLSPMEEKAHRSSQRIGCGCLILALAIFACFLAWIVWDSRIVFD